MAWPPPVSSKPFSRAARMMAPKSTPATERAEPRPNAVFESGDECRLVVPFLQPSCDDADHAHVPALAGDQHERRIRLLQRQRFSLFQNARFDGLAFAVVPVEFIGQAVRFYRIVGGK